MEMDTIVEDVVVIEEDILVDAAQIDEVDIAIVEDMSTDEDFESDAINSESDEG
jgi:hypothetical protein